MTYQEWLSLKEKSPFGVPFLQHLPDGEYFITLERYGAKGITWFEEGWLFVKKGETYSCGPHWFCSNIILQEFFTARVIQIHPKINLDHITYDS